MEDTLRINHSASSIVAFMPSDWLNAFQVERVARRIDLTMTDREYLEKRRVHVADTRTFLGNKMKPERERTVCRAFLRAIGVSFIDSELHAPTVEPVDVEFRDARFQVRDLLRDRKRGDDWKNRETRYAEAQSPQTSSNRIRHRSRRA